VCFGKLATAGLTIGREIILGFKMNALASLVSCASRSKGSGAMAVREVKTSLKVGDEVRPRPEWQDDPNRNGAPH
jgi:hypothetical protein